MHSFGIDKFNRASKDFYIKKEVKDLTGSELYKYDPLQYQWAIDSNKRSDLNWKQYIYQYLRAAELLQNALSSKRSMGLRFFTEENEALAFMFNCRHAVELSIKYQTVKLGFKYNKQHSILDLYDDLIKQANGSLKKCDIQLLDRMRDFVCIIDGLDNKSGTNMRYPEDKNGDTAIPGSICINTDEIYKQTCEFVNILTSMK